MTYLPINDFLLVEKKETSGLTVAGQNDDPTAIMRGTVVQDNDDSNYVLQGQEIIFIRGHARELKLDGKEYFIIKEDKVLIHVQDNS